MKPVTIAELAKLIDNSPLDALEFAEALNIEVRWDGGDSLLEGWFMPTPELWAAASAAVGEELNKRKSA